MRWARKGSYFYVIDAFVAGIIILAGVAVLFQSYIDDPLTTSAFFTAEDFFSVLEDTEVRNMDSDLIKNWTRNGTINDSTRTLLEQLTFFNATDRDFVLGQFCQEVVEDLPPNVAGSILIDSNVLATTPNPLVEKNDSYVFFSSKRIVMIRNSPWEVYDPVLVEVQTWQ